MTFPEPTHMRPPSISPARPLSHRSADDGSLSIEIARRQIQSARELVIDLLAAYAALETRAMRDADPDLKADIDAIRDIAGVNTVGHDIHQALADAQTALRRALPPK